MKLNRLGFFKQVPLQGIIVKGNLSELKKALENGADCNTVMDIDFADYVGIGEEVNPEHFRFSKIAPLHLAVLRGDPDMVELLLQYGANIHAKDGEGLRPLNHYSVKETDDISSRNDTIKILQLLFKYGETQDNFIKIFGKETLEIYKSYSQALNHQANFNP